MLFACIAISFNIYDNSDNMTTCIFISSFELYNPFILILELAVLYLLSEMLFSTKTLEKSLFYIIFQYLKIGLNILFPISIFISYISPMFWFSILVVVLLFIYLIFIIFLPIHIYYIYKIGYALVTSSYKFIKDLYKYKKITENQSIRVGKRLPPGPLKLIN